MTVSNGSLANQTTFNNGFVSRTADDNTTGKKDLQNAVADSGPDVINVQREVNSLNAYTGRPSGSAHDADPVWTSNEVGASTDSLKDRAEALTVEFDEVTGHTHDGTAGNGGPVSAADLTNINYYRAVRQSQTVLSGTGSSVVVTTEMIGKTSGGGAAVVGVATTGAQNRCWITDATDESAIVDAGGQVVYGRITEAAGVWTLSSYTNEAGVETAYTYPSSISIRFYFSEVYTLDGVPTFPEDAGYIQSLDFTADIVDASTTQRGLVSASAQTLGGDKTFQDFIEASSEFHGNFTDIGTSGSAVTLATPTTMISRLTSGTLVSFEGLTAPTKSQLVAIFNATGNDVDILDDTAATAVDGILTGSGNDFTLTADSAVLLIYDLTTDRWRIVGGGSGGAAPSTTLDSSIDIENLAIATSVGSSALTIALKTKAGSDATALDPVNVAMRDITLTSGTYNIRTVISALSLVISSGSTLGQVNGQPSTIFVYLIDNAGTLELAASHSLFREDTLATTTAEGGAGAADSATVMYSATARTGVPFRLIGKIINTQTTAGTWASAGTQIQIAPFAVSKVPTFQKFTSGSGTYVTPAGCTYLKVTAMGGGGGGEGTGGSPVAPTSGANSTFGSSLITAGGGGLSQSLSTGLGGTGGSATATGLTAILAIGGRGNVGVNASVTASSVSGGTGGYGALGGGGSGGFTVNGVAGAANTGGGGGGGSSPSTTGNATGGGGGGSGGYVQATIVNPDASYSYAVGAGGNAGTANSFSGGAGGSGLIFVEEFYT